MVETQQVMVTVPGIMGQMSLATAQSMGYTNYSIVPPTTQQPAPQTPAPEEGSIEWYQAHGLEPDIGYPSTAQEIVESGGAGLPPEVLQAAEEAVAAGEGESPQVAIEYLESTGKSTNLNPVEVVSALGEEKATTYFQKAGVEQPQETVRKASETLKATRTLQQVLGKQKWETAFSTTDIDKAVKIVAGTARSMGVEIE